MGVGKSEESRLSKPPLFADLGYATALEAARAQLKQPDEMLSWLGGVMRGGLRSPSYVLRLRSRLA